jgi:hypothetical protein
MEGFGDNLLLVFRNGFMTEQEYEAEVELISHILRIAWTNENFCTVHELLDRNRITSNPQRIDRESRHYQLRPFRFLINKN